MSRERSERFGPATRLPLRHRRPEALAPLAAHPTSVLPAARRLLPPMRITFVLPHAGFAGGIRVAAIYAERLGRRGHEVVVVSRPRRPVSLRDMVRSLAKGRGWPSARSVGGHFDGTPVDHRVIDRWRPIAAGDVPDADVVVATWWETAEWVAAMPPAKGAKVYFLQHDETATHGQPLDRVAATWKLPMRHIAVASWIAAVGRERYGAGDVAVVANAVDGEQFDAPPARQAGRADGRRDVLADAVQGRRPVARRLPPRGRKGAGPQSRRVRAGRGVAGPAAAGGHGIRPPAGAAGSSRRSTPRATPGCSAAGARASGCRSSRRWRAGRP